MSKYRLSAKPGLARAGRFVNTKIQPVIISQKPNVAQIKPTPPPPSPKPIARPIQRAVPQQRPAVSPKSTQAVSPVQKSHLKQSKGSPLRNRGDREIERYRVAIEKLRGVGKGRVLIMVACGPSVLEVDFSPLKGHPLIDFMTINRPEPRLHPTRYWAFCDHSQYTRSKDLFESYTGIVINAWGVRARHPNQVLVRNMQGKYGFSKDLLKGYFIGRSTTYANMQTAHWMDYDKVFIFGCDMCKPPNSDKLHFYGVNQDVDPSIRMKRFEQEAQHYLEGARILSAQEREKFVFCTAYNPWPFMQHFPKLDHREAVAHILTWVAQKEQK